MKHRFWFFCWLLIIGCSDEEPKFESAYTGNYEFTIESTGMDPFGPPGTTHFSWKSTGEIQAKSKNIVLVKINMDAIPDFEIEVDDNKMINSHYTTLESGVKMSNDIIGEFDTANNLNIEYFRGAYYGGSVQYQHLIYGKRVD
jgi:hypothetical protein